MLRKRKETKQANEKRIRRKKNKGGRRKTKWKKKKKFLATESNQMYQIFLGHKNQFH